MNAATEKGLANLTKVEIRALYLYLEHNNAWAEDSSMPEQWRVSIDDFFSEHWKETYHLRRVKVGWYDMVIMSVGTGDDGGPAKLYIWTPGEGYPGHDDGFPHIEAIVQEFDTMVNEIYNSEAGGFTSWPGRENS